VLASAKSLPEAFSRTLEVIGKTLGWSLGAIWVADPETEGLRCDGVWHQDSQDLADFAQASRRKSFARGEGLPGRVWALGRPVWISDAVHDPTFSRAGAAVDARLHAAFGFPIFQEDKVVAVMEFFAGRVEEPDQAILRTMEAIANDVSQFIWRMRAERERDQALDALERANTALLTRTEEAEYARQLAEEANQSKSAFLANMSHELRTPLNAIVGYTELLELGVVGPVNDQQAEYLDRLRSSTGHLIGLVNEVLGPGESRVGSATRRAATRRAGRNSTGGHRPHRAAGGRTRRRGAQPCSA
jgi:signal transduction histidine kinase